MSRKLKIIYGVVALVAVIDAVLFFVAYKNFSATTVSLESTDGKVSLLDKNDREVEIFDGIRIRGGNSIKTGSDGLADVLLDSDRLVVVREKSNVRFDQKGKKIHLTVEDGDVFFHIRKKLESNEKLTFDTVTMSIGIRGTSGLATVNNKKEALYLTSGKVEIIVSEPEGKKTDEYDLMPGEVLKCDYSGDELVVVKEEFLPEVMPKVLLEEITKNLDLLKTVLDETGWDGYDIILAAQDLDVTLPDEVYAYLLEVSDLDETEPEVADITEEAEDEEFVPLPYESWGGLYSGSDNGTYYYVWLERGESSSASSPAGTITLLWKGSTRYSEGDKLLDEDPRDIYYGDVDNGYVIKPGWDGDASSVLTIDEDDRGNLSGKIFTFGFWLTRDESLGYNGKTMKYITEETGDAIIDENEWKNAYYVYLFDENVYGVNEESEFRLIYLNDDNVPEIVLKERSYEDNFAILSYDRKRGVYEVFRIYCETAYYIPRSGYMYYEEETYGCPVGYYSMSSPYYLDYGYFEYVSETAPVGISDGDLEKIGDFYLSMTEGGMDYLQMQSYLD